MNGWLRCVSTALIAAMLLSIPPSAAAWTSLNTQLQPYLSRYELPALAAAVVKNGKIVSAGAVGTRRAGESIPVTINDRFHIGSDTKAMTALLAAMLVDEGKLQWTSTVAEVFPELAVEMDPGFGKVTLLQLLSHTGGIPPDSEELEKALIESFMQSGNLDELRYQFIRICSKKHLAFEPGTQWAYSNTGYVLTGAIIERKTGRTWDEVITERIFRPLKMRTAGLGAPSSLGKIDAPLGHLVVDGKVKAFLAGPSGDNPAVIGPAGIAHMSVLDFAHWAGWNAGQGKRGPPLVKAETLKKLHTPIADINLNKPSAPGTPSPGKYALGWGQVQPAWAPHPLLTHNGSNTKNLAKICIDLKQDVALVIMTNIGGPKADQALNSLNEALYRRFAK